MHLLASMEPIEHSTRSNSPRGCRTAAKNDLVEWNDSNDAVSLSRQRDNQ